METCEWCQKPIQETPLIHDSDLDIYFHCECSKKDDAIDWLWLGNHAEV